MGGTAFGPEFSLLVRCCRWNFATAEGEPRPEISADLDWSQFVHLARRHRVEGLAWNALAQQADRLPVEAKEALSSDARAIAAKNLAIAGECRELGQIFEDSDTPLLFVKGLSVGSLAYRSPMLKMGWDIDLLIDPRDLAAAAAMLAERRFALRLPSNRAVLHIWHNRSKESVWHRNEDLFVELHTRLADNRRLIPTIDVHSPQQLVDIAPGVSLPTLAEEELLAYLAVHGASSAWFRLKWISDFAALQFGRSGEEIGRLYRRSQDLGAARASGQALLLADSLFGILRPAPALRESLMSDRETRLLCQAALRMVAKCTREPTEQFLGTFTIHWTQLLLRPGLGYKFSELWRQCAGLVSRLGH